MKSSLTIKQALKKYSPIEIELLLPHVLGKPREFLYMEWAHELTRKQTDELTRMIKRRMAGEPVAYILDYKDFYGLRFKVDRNVLIPRPESEWLVERIIASVIPNLIGNLKLLEKDSRFRGNDKLKILDLGTGSGCIAISLAKSLVSRVTLDTTASDISQKALAVAKQNAKRHKASAKFVLSDLFNNIQGKFDVIIANLPYVPKKIYDLGFKNLKFEPISALTDGTGSFQIYRRFFEQVGGHIDQHSTILLEIDPSSRKFITEYQKKYLPSGKLKFYKDFNNFWRYAEIKF